MDQFRRPGQPAIEQSQGSSLQNWYDLDPQRWTWFCLPTTISIGVGENSKGIGEVQLLNHPQYVTRITHQILGNTSDAEATGLHQDGQYSIELKDQKTIFTLMAVQANNLFGPYVNGQFPDLSFPKYYQGVNTLNFTVVNLYTRLLSPEADFFNIQIAVHGVADLSMGGAR